MIFLFCGCYSRPRYSVDLMGNPELVSQTVRTSVFAKKRSDAYTDIKKEQQITSYNLGFSAVTHRRNIVINRESAKIDSKGVSTKVLWGAVYHANNYYNKGDNLYFYGILFNCFGVKQAMKKKIVYLLWLPIFVQKDEENLNP